MLILGWKPTLSEATEAGKKRLFELTMMARWVGAKSNIQYFHWYDGGEDEEVSSKRYKRNVEREQLSSIRRDAISERQPEVSLVQQRQFSQLGVFGNMLVIISLILLAMLIFIQIVKSLG